MRTSRRENAYYVLNTIHWIAILVTVVFAVIAVFDTPAWCVKPSGIWNALRVIVEFLQRQQKLVLAFAAPTVVVSKVLAAQVGPAWLWKTVERLLTEYRDECFTKETLAEAEFHHRVTLFQHVDFRTWWFWFTYRCWFCCWRRQPPAGFRTPWSGWLIVVRRSGHTTKRTNTTFLAPDDADYTEGIAGQAWGENRRILIKDLPNLTVDSSDEEKKLYSQRTNSTIQWLECRINKNKHLARSILAMPIEVNNRPWGVMVIDSRRPDGIKEGHAKGIQEFFVVVLGKLLQRV